MKICYINNFLYILILFLLALILYDGFINKRNYEKNIEKFYQDESTGDTNVTVDLEKAVLRGDSKEVSDNEILVKTEAAAANVSENTQKMEKILDSLEKISNDFNQSIEDNEKIVNKYNKILEDINSISDIDPKKIYKFLSKLKNDDILRDILSGVEILKNIIKSQIDKKSESVQSHPNPVDEQNLQSIEEYSYALIGSGHCDQYGSGAEITLLNNNDCFTGSSTDSVQKCKQQCNNTTNCDYISFTSSPVMHHCCLYNDPNNDCNLGANGSGNGFQPPKSDWNIYWQGFQTYKKLNYQNI